MTPAPDIPADGAPWARPLYEVQVADMSELAAMGMDLARQAHGDVEADPGQKILTFSRAARAVRLTYLLQARLIKDLEARDRGLVEPAAAPAEAYQPIRIERIFVDPPESHRLEAERTERFIRERAERLDCEADILARPVNEVIAVIRQDLGLDPDEPPPPLVIPEATTWRSGTQGLQRATGDDPTVPDPSPGSRLSAPLRPG